jgi:hypothetical protein
MKTSFPRNSIPAVPVTGGVGFHSAFVAANKVTATVINTVKQYLLVVTALSPVIAILSTWTIAVQAADADNFELAMVIKETTNPYYLVEFIRRIAAGS